MRMECNFLSHSYFHYYICCCFIVLQLCSRALVPSHRITLVLWLSKGQAPENLAGKRGKRARKGPGVHEHVTMVETTTSFHTP